MASIGPHGTNKICLMPRPSVPTIQKCHDHKILSLLVGPKGAKGAARLEWCNSTFHLWLKEVLHPSFHYWSFSRLPVTQWMTAGTWDMWTHLWCKPDHLTKHRFVSRRKKGSVYSNLVTLLLSNPAADCCFDCTDNPTADNCVYLYTCIFERGERVLSA